MIRSTGIIIDQTPSLTKLPLTVNIIMTTVCLDRTVVLHKHNHYQLPTRFRKPNSRTYEDHQNKKTVHCTSMV